MNTPCGKDLLREVVDAFRAEGLHVGFYYSLIDWHHPDFIIDRLHPYRDLPKEEIDKLNAGRDMAKYREYMRNQVTELLTNYGKIDILWFDFSYPGENGTGHDDWGSSKLNNYFGIETNILNPSAEGVKLILPFSASTRSRIFFKPMPLSFISEQLPLSSSMS